jgi:hypothetical protein
MIAGPPRRLRLDIEAERSEIEHVDEGIDRAYRIIFRDIVVDAVRKKRRLAAIQPLDEALHASPRS